ncbi:MAG: CDP-alcohol phosphatidyltransferase family protein [Prevotella sp.]
MNFKTLLQASFKSKDTEEWLDVHFTRPIGLVLALAFKAIKVHPNTITIISIILGVAAAWMFYHTDLYHNIIGIILLMTANFLDSADGQLARLTGQKTFFGRVLDGFAGDVWFFSIYFAICCRLMPENIPFTDIKWGYSIWLLGYVAGILCHSPQSSLADYYRQIHLLMIKGKEGSELGSYEAERETLKKLSYKQWFAYLYHLNYSAYCRSQERRTPEFQKLKELAMQHYGNLSAMPADVRNRFIAGSRPLMKYTNILTFNTRAICLYITCLANITWVYFLFDIVVMGSIYIYMHRSHERLCRETYLSISINKKV